MSNVQNSRSGLKCQRVGSDIDLTDVRIPWAVRLKDPRPMIGTLVGSVIFICGATGVVWLTGLSISLNAVSGSSARGTTDAKATTEIRNRRNVHAVRLTMEHPDGVEPYCLSNSLSSRATDLLAALTSFKALSSFFLKGLRDLSSEGVETLFDYYRGDYRSGVVGIQSTFNYLGRKM